MSVGIAGGGDSCLCLFCGALLIVVFSALDGEGDAPPGYGDKAGAYSRVSSDFFWGLLCAFTIFTIGFSIVLAILDGISIGMTGLIGAFGVQKAYRTGQLSWKEGLLHGILQFVFCADVVSIVALYLKIKNGQKC